jgi:uncharacterized protein
MPGTPVHVEIPAADAAEGSVFWGALFGWEFQAFEGSPSPYLMTRITDATGGAVYEDAAARGLRVYFDVDDVDAGAARVRELGGQAAEKLPVPSMGWFSRCTDPAGNEFGLWQSDTSASM